MSFPRGRPPFAPILFRCAALSRGAHTAGDASKLTLPRCRADQGNQQFGHEVVCVEALPMQGLTRRADFDGLHVLYRCVPELRDSPRWDGKLAAIDEIHVDPLSDTVIRRAHRPRLLLTSVPFSSSRGGNLRKNVAVRHLVLSHGIASTYPTTGRDTPERDDTLSQHRRRASERRGQFRAAVRVESPRSSFSVVAT